MKTLLAIFIMLFATQGIAKAQKDSIVIIQGIHEDDKKRVAKMLRKQIRDGNLKGAIYSASLIERDLRPRDLERIVKKNIRLYNVQTAYKAASMNNRKLKFKEAFKAIWDNPIPFDTMYHYTDTIKLRDAKKLKDFYIENGDLISAEKSAEIYEEKMSPEEYIAIYRYHFFRQNTDIAIIAAKKAGSAGREELGKLLLFNLNQRNIEDIIKVAAAIGGRDLRNREWHLIKNSIPNDILEESIEYIEKGAIPKMP